MDKNSALKTIDALLFGAIDAGIGLRERDYDLFYKSKVMLETNERPRYVLLNLLLMLQERRKDASTQTPLG